MKMFSKIYLGKAKPPMNRWFWGMVGNDRICYAGHKMSWGDMIVGTQAQKNGVPLPAVQFVSFANICTITIQIRDGTPSYLKGIKNAFV